MPQAFRMRVGMRAPDGTIGSVVVDARLDVVSVASARECARANALSTFLDDANYAWITDEQDRTVWFLKLEEGWSPPGNRRASRPNSGRRRGTSANYPGRRTRKPVVVWFTLPAGPRALAVWTRGDAEGEVYADANWQKGTGEQARRRAESLADNAIGVDAVTWLWHPIAPASRARRRRASPLRTSPMTRRRSTAAASRLA